MCYNNEAIKRRRRRCATIELCARSWQTHDAIVMRLRDIIGTVSMRVNTGSITRRVGVFQRSEEIAAAPTEPAIESMRIFISSINEETSQIYWDAHMAPAIENGWPFSVHVDELLVQIVVLSYYPVSGHLDICFGYTNISASHHLGSTPFPLTPLRLYKYDTTNHLAPMFAMTWDGSPVISPRGFRFPFFNCFGANSSVQTDRQAYIHSYRYRRCWIGRCTHSIVRFPNQIN